MKKESNSIMLATVIGMLALSAGCTPAHTESGKQARTETPVRAETKRETMSAQVVAIDKENRILTLQDKEGMRRDVKVNERVQRFDEIKVGDTITAEYFESTAVSLRKQVPGEPTVVSPSPTVQVAPPGESPAGVVANTVVVTARVEDVDQENRRVTLRGPQGDITSMHVAEGVSLDEVKKGDQVVVTYSEAIAVGVSPGGGTSE